jgi:hypothetical protein
VIVNHPVTFFLNGEPRSDRNLAGVFVFDKTKRATTFLGGMGNLSPGRFSADEFLFDPPKRLSLKCRRFLQQQKARTSKVDSASDPTPLVDDLRVGFNDRCIASHPAVADLTRTKPVQTLTANAERAVWGLDLIGNTSALSAGGESERALGGV